MEKKLLIETIQKIEDASLILYFYGFITTYLELQEEHQEST